MKLRASFLASHGDRKYIGHVFEIPFLVLLCYIFLWGALNSQEKFSTKPADTIAPGINRFDIPLIYFPAKY